MFDYDSYLIEMLYQSPDILRDEDIKYIDTHYEKFAPFINDDTPDDDDGDIDIALGNV